LQGKTRNEKAGEKISFSEETLSLAVPKARLPVNELGFPQQTSVNKDLQQEAKNGRSPKPCNLREPIGTPKLHLEKTNGTISAAPFQAGQKNIPRYQSKQWQKQCNRYGRQYCIDTRQQRGHCNGVNSRQSRFSYPKKSSHEMQMGEVKRARENQGSWDEVGSQRSDGHERQMQDGWASCQHDNWRKTKAPIREVARDGLAGHARTSWQSWSETPRRGRAQNDGANTCASASWKNHLNETRTRGFKRGNRDFDQVGRHWGTKMDDWRNDTSPYETKRGRIEYDMMPDGNTRAHLWPCQVKPSISPWDRLSVINSSLRRTYS
jgi:hypothetical protein